MHHFDQRTAIARCLNDAGFALLEASERSSDLQMIELSLQLLDQAVKLGKLAGEFLELAGKPSLREQQADLPF